ncbi:hypothetical protein MHB50_00180 [Siminovitchia sp. FSL H7-0308]|uniref:hypothetical protein n=1 Tax=unclassified Siminovitchia TaxID=2837530 RepID=UPI0030D050BA
MSIWEDVIAVHHTCKHMPLQHKLILTALFSGLAAAFQSAGALFPGAGCLISLLSTAPIIVCTIFSLPLGMLSYFLTILMLFFYPSELLIFPFTTGLLGLAIGFCFLITNTRLTAGVITCLTLASGIFFVLYGLQFPLLGPVVSTSPDIRIVFGILLFSAWYGWIWLWTSHFFIKRFRNMIA